MGGGYSHGDGEFSGKLSGGRGLGRGLGTSTRRSEILFKSQ